MEYKIFPAIGYGSENQSMISTEVSLIFVLLFMYYGFVGVIPIHT